MNVSAIILAGGKGERLKPITETRPKPLCIVGGISILERNIICLKKAGINDITVAAGYMAEKIEKECKRLCVKCFIEKGELGTAGCVRAINNKGNVLIISGDGINEFDINKFAEYSESSPASAIIAFTENENPTLFGSAISDEEGYIKSFREKPSWEKVVTDMVNTGIYFLKPESVEVIHENTEYDFSRNLFPEMIKRKMKIGFYAAEGYWCDIGNPQSYIKTAMRFANGKNAADRSARIDISASVHGSVIMENVKIEKNATVINAIICENTVIGESALVKSGTVIGANSVIGKNAVIEENTILPSNSITEEGKIIKTDSGNKYPESDTHGVIFGMYGKNMTAESALSLGKAIGDTSEICSETGIMTDGKECSGIIAESIGMGIKSVGRDYVNLMEGYESLCAYCADEFGLAYSVYVTESEGNITISIYGRMGNAVDDEVTEKIMRGMKRQIKNSEIPGKTIMPEGFMSPVSRYTNMLAKYTESCNKFSVSFGNGKANTAETVLASVMPKRQNPEWNIRISENGRSVNAVKHGTEKEINGYEILEYYAKSEAEKKSGIVLPENTPDAVLKYASEEKCRCKREDGENPVEDFAYRDAALLTAKVFNILSERGATLDSIYETVPRIVTETDGKDYPENKKANKMKQLCKDAENPDGAIFRTEKGTVRIIPSARRGFKIISEAASNEYAKELCEFAKEKISDPEE